MGVKQKITVEWIYKQNEWSISSNRSLRKIITQHKSFDARGKDRVKMLTKAKKRRQKKEMKFMISILYSRMCVKFHEKEFIQTKQISWLLWRRLGLFTTLDIKLFYVKFPNKWWQLFSKTEHKIFMVITRCVHISHIEL